MQVETPSTVAMPDPVVAPVRVAFREPMSPFLPWSTGERAAIPEAQVEDVARDNLLFDLLRNPETMIDRLLDTQRAQRAIVGSIASIIGCVVFATVMIMAAWAEPKLILRSAAMVPLSVLGALAASLGAIYALGVLCSARLPLGRIVAVQLASVAPGTMLLATLSPLAYALWALDGHWAGPLFAVALFAVCAGVAGAKLRRLFTCLAHRMAPAGQLSAADSFRLGAFSRMSLMSLGLALAVGTWAFIV